MSGPAPKLPGERVRSPKPARGEWQAAPGVGWRHGPIPPPPSGLLRVSRDAWMTWMSAWFASHWTPSDLPGLRVVVGLYDRVQRRDLARAPELRQMMDNYGITPKGQQDRRWLPPKGAEVVPGPTERDDDLPTPYAGLKLVN